MNLSPFYLSFLIFFHPIDNVIMCYTRFIIRKLPWYSGEDRSTYFCSDDLGKTQVILFGKKYDVILQPIWKKNLISFEHFDLLYKLIFV